MEAIGEEAAKENTTNALPQNNNNNPDDTPAPTTPQDTSKKIKKEERLKVDKNVEQFMKSLNAVPTMEEKFSLVCKKFAQTSEENKKLHFFIKQTDKRFALIEKERDQLQLEYNKVVLVKSKLENLCRELQKQNKAVKEESILRIREEEERRKETQSKFQNTLSEITALLQQNNEKNAKLRDDNVNMSERFKSVVQQYQLREQQVDKMAKQMSLESQLSDAKLQKASLEHQAEKERILAEMEQLKVTLTQYRAKIMEMQNIETSLRGQLGVYTEKYDEFQNALVKSNNMFIGFKDQMEKMSKKIQKLEKESLMWKKRWETSQTALLDMCGERQASEERCTSTAKHLHHMQSLCRTLQAERILLLTTLKENNIERPPVPQLPPAQLTPPPPCGHAPNQQANNTKVDEMAANCAQLRQSLAQIQSQLTTLTTNAPVPEDEPAKEKPKKSKSKKSKAEKLAQKQAAGRAETKEQESEESNIVAEETQPSTSEIKIEPKSNEEPDDKIDSETMDCLIHAINMANINICDFVTVNDEENDDNVSKDAVVEEIIDDLPSIIDVTNQVAPVDETNIDEATSNNTESTTVIGSNANKVESNVNENVAQVNGSQIIVDKVGEPVATKSIDKTPLVNKVSEESSVPSPKTGKEVGEVISQEKLPVTQATDVQSVSNDS